MWTLVVLLVVIGDESKQSTKSTNQNQMFGCAFQLRLFKPILTEGLNWRKFIGEKRLLSNQRHFAAIIATSYYVLRRSLESHLEIMDFPFPRLLYTSLA